MCAIADAENPFISLSLSLSLFSFRGGGRRKEMFYLTTHSTHFIYGYMASDIWLRTILIVRKETCCHHIGYSFQLTARVLLYAALHRHDITYHGLCYTSRGALAGTRNSSMGSPHEGSIRRLIARGACAPHFFYSGGGGGGNGRFVPPTHTLLTTHFYFPLELYDKQLFGIFHIPINYLVDSFNKLTQMAVIK